MSKSKKDIDKIGGKIPSVNTARKLNDPRIPSRSSSNSSISPGIGNYKFGQKLPENKRIRDVIKGSLKDNSDSANSSFMSNNKNQRRESQFKNNDKPKHFYLSPPGKSRQNSVFVSSNSKQKEIKKAKLSSRKDSNISSEANNEFETKVSNIQQAIDKKKAKFQFSKTNSKSNIELVPNKESEEEKAKPVQTSVIEDHGNGFLYNRSLHDISLQNAINLVETNLAQSSQLEAKNNVEKLEIDIGIIPADNDAKDEIGDHYKLMINEVDISQIVQEETEITDKNEDEETLIQIQGSTKVKPLRVKHKIAKKIKSKVKGSKK